MATKTRMSVDEFLAMPETEPPSELVDGEVVQKAMPSSDHGEIVLELGSLLRNYLRETGVGRAATEVRHAQRNAGWVYLPDIEVRLGPRTTPRGSTAPVESPPDFAIEVLSPDDRAGRVLERVNFYMAAGVPLLWIIDPVDELLVVYRPGTPPATFEPPAVIDASPVLPGFRLDLAALSGILPGAGESGG